MGFLFSGNNFITFVKNKFLKTKLNKIKQVVILILTMLLASCSKDTYEELVQETKNPLKVKNLKARDLKKQGNLVKKLDHFKAFTKLLNLNHKTEASSIYDFSIDTNNFKLIEKDRVKYYTFKVNRTIDNGMLENLQITKKTDGTYVAKLLQYSLSTSEKALLLSGGRLDVNGKLKVVNIEDPDFLSNINLKFRGDCFDMIITTQENLCALGGHSYGQACPLPPNQQPKPDSRVYTVVSGPCGDSGDNGLGDGVFSPPGGLGNQPLEPLDAFLTSLSAEQQQWLDNQSETTQGNIYSYLNVNNYNTTSSNFIKDVVNLSKDLEINAMDVWNDYEMFRAQMSNDERNVFDNMLINRRLMYIVAAKKAINETEERYPTTAKNGTGDAFRHALWNGMSSLLIGENLTEQLTTAHETRPSDYTYTFKEKDMDLYNNLKGRQIANYSNVFTITDNVVNYLQIGGLRFLNNLDNNSLATYNSVLVPTN